MFLVRWCRVSTVHWSGGPIHTVVWPGVLRWCVWYAVILVRWCSVRWSYTYSDMARCAEVVCLVCSDLGQMVQGVFSATIRWSYTYSDMAWCAKVVCLVCSDPGQMVQGVFSATIRWSYTYSGMARCAEVVCLVCGK